MREGTRQAEMLAFPFAAAREPAKLPKRVLSGLRKGTRITLKSISHMLHILYLIDIIGLIQAGL